MTTQQQTTAIQRREALDFIPANIDEAWRHSELYSRSGLLPDALKGKPHDVLICLLTGAELGISPMQALREVYVIRGKTFIASALRVAIVRQSKECLAWQLVESTPERATYRTQRRGDATPTTMTFTMAEAERAGLPAQNPKYKTDPALMLRRRCASRLIDEVYPDVIRGVSDAEEAAEVPEVHATGPAQVQQLRHVPSTSAPPSPAPAVEEAQEVTPPPAPPPEKPAAEVEQPQQETPAPAREPSLAEVLLSEIPSCQTTREVDSISRRAKDLPKGPERDAVGAAIIARRAELKGAA